MLGSLWERLVGLCGGGGVADFLLLLLRLRLPLEDGGRDTDVGMFRSGFGDADLSWVRFDLRVFGE